jgi:hypothetical protein
MPGSCWPFSIQPPSFLEVDKFKEAHFVAALFDFCDSPENWIGEIEWICFGDS